MIRFIKFTLIFLLVLLWSCNGESQGIAYSNFEYDLSNPYSKVKLKDELDEISGLSPTGLDSIFAAVQDEKGRIYFVNAYTGDIVSDLKIDKGGDFEGVEIVDQTAYVMRSDGLVLKVDNYLDTGFTVEKFKFSLPKPCDAESLGYMSSRKVFIVSCKSGAIGEDKAFWAFDPVIQQIRPQPLMKIELSKLDDFVAGNKWGTSEKILFTLEGAGIFPSGIAIHPITGEWYILSSANKRLVILTAAGELKYVIPLYQDSFKQPEGIAFGKNAELVISNEGKNGKANIMVFKQKKISGN